MIIPLPETDLKENNFSKWVGRRKTEDNSMWKFKVELKKQGHYQ